MSHSALIYKHPASPLDKDKLTVGDRVYDITTFKKVKFRATRLTVSGSSWRFNH